MNLTRYAGCRQPSMAAALRAHFVRPVSLPAKQSINTMVATGSDPRWKRGLIRWTLRETGLGAFTEEEFGWKTIMWVLKNTGIGINFGTTILLGFIVGMAIAGQTFYLFTVENIRQFGALKAMGASIFTLARMILLQAFTVGLTGYGVGVGLATGFGFLTAQGGNLPFADTWQFLLLVLMALLSICTFSAMISIIKLAPLEPAIVFR